jgi:hypothetical protein
MPNRVRAASASERGRFEIELKDSRGKCASFRFRCLRWPSWGCPVSDPAENASYLGRSRSPPDHLQTENPHPGRIQVAVIL